MMKRFSAFTKTFEFSALALLTVLVIINILLQPNFFKPAMFRSMINSYVPVILLSMGQGILLLKGGPDLSLGNACSLANCILATIMLNDTTAFSFIAILAAFAACMAMGFINGFVTGFLRIPSMIVTFCTMNIWIGIAFIIRPTSGGSVANWFRGFYNLEKVEGMPQIFINIGNIFPPALVMVILGVLIWSFVKRTRTGRYIYATGGNEEAAYESGIRTQWVIVSANMIAYLFVFLAAVFFTAQNMSGDANLAGSMTLTTVASAAIGGIAIGGGRGKVSFAIVGALIIQIVMKIVFFAGVPNEFQELVRGLIIILAAIISIIYTFKRPNEKIEVNAE